MRVVAWCYCTMGGSEPNGAGAKAGSLLGEKAIVSEMHGRLEVRDQPVVVSVIFVVEGKTK